LENTLSSAAFWKTRKQVPDLPENGRKNTALFQKERHFSGYSLDLRIFHVTDRDYFRRYYVFNRRSSRV